MPSSQSDAIFNAAHAVAAAWEGGLCDDPDDRGRITNFGISIVFLRDFASTQKHRDVLDQMGVILPVTDNTIRALSFDQAKAIHKLAFWLESGISELPAPMAFALYDFAMNAGPSAAIKVLQRALNVHGARCSVDGKLGPITYAAAQATMNTVRSLVDSIYTHRLKYYTDIVEKRPGQSKFLQGWKNRNAASLRACKQCMQEYGYA